MTLLRILEAGSILEEMKPPEKNPKMIRAGA